MQRCMRYISGDPTHYICGSVLFNFGLLFLVMIFDAVNIKQTNKIIISSFAVGSFVYSTLLWSQIGFYRSDNDIYDQSSVTIPDLFKVSSIQINIVDIAANSAQILAIFLLKQMISSFRKPKQASVIKKKPFLIYENKKESTPKRKSIKNWKRITVLFWSLTCLLFAFFGFVVAINNGDNVESIVLWIIFVLFVFSLICLFMSGKTKLLWIGNSIVFVLIITYGIAVFLLKYMAVLYGIWYCSDLCDEGMFE